MSALASDEEHQCENLITVTYSDRSFSGVWRIVQDVLLVESAYGRGSARLGLRTSDPDRLAEFILTDVVDDWLSGAGPALH